MKKDAKELKTIVEGLYRPTTEMANLVDKIYSRTQTIDVQVDKVIKNAVGKHHKKIDTKILDTSQSKENSNLALMGNEIKNLESRLRKMEERNTHLIQ